MKKITNPTLYINKCSEEPFELANCEVILKGEFYIIKIIN